MPAYVIVDVTVTDPLSYEEYKKLVPASLAAYDGRFIVRGGKTIRMEGEWQPERLVVLEFPTVDRAREWWASEEYAAAKKIRYAAATTSMIIIEGISDVRSLPELSASL